MKPSYLTLILTFGILISTSNELICVSKLQIWSESPKQSIKYRVHKLSGRKHGRTIRNQCLHLTVAED